MWAGIFLRNGHMKDYIDVCTVPYSSMWGKASCDKTVVLQNADSKELLTVICIDFCAGIDNGHF